MSSGESGTDAHVSSGDQDRVDSSEFGSLRKVPDDSATNRAGKRAEAPRSSEGLLFNSISTQQQPSLGNHYDADDIGGGNPSL